MVTPGGEAVDHLVLSKRYGLFLVILDLVNIILDGSTDRQDLDVVGLLLTLLDQINLGVRNDADEFAVEDHFL